MAGSVKVSTGAGAVWVTTDGGATYVVDPADDSVAGGGDSMGMLGLFFPGSWGPGALTGSARDSRAAG